jgi:prepilin-type N-terminal cleavage/methylation domain-containing protein
VDLTMRRAFTIVEVMVTVGVIALLLAILIPTLRGARKSADEIVVLSNLRGVGVVFERYTQANRGFYPFIERGSTLQIVPPGEPEGVSLSTNDPWVARYAWVTVMHEVAPWREHYATWVSRRGQRGDGPPWGDPTVPGELYPRWPSYHYSNSFVADPAVWSGNAGASEDMLRPQRASSTAHPGSKALVFDAAREYLVDPRVEAKRGVLAADGSAALRWDRDIRAPFPNPLRGGEALRYHDTPNGLLGTDW